MPLIMLVFTRCEFTEVSSKYNLVLGNNTPSVDIIPTRMHLNLFRRDGKAQCCVLIGGY